MCTLGDISRQGAQKYGDREAVVFENVRLTYRELNKRVNCLANAIAARGYTAGDRLVILSNNSHKYLEVYLAAGKLGMSTVPLNFMLPDDELIHMVNESEATLFIAGNGFTGRCARMKSKLEQITGWITMDNCGAGYLYYEDLLKSSSDGEPVTRVDTAEMAVLAYTNGTTGEPKGVMLSHRNVISSAMATLGLMDFNPSDCGCFVLPFFQTEIVTVLCMLIAGGKVVINRKVKRAEILRLIQEEKCTYINMVPKLYDWLQQDPDIDRYDLSSLRVMNYSGGAFPLDKLEQCVKKFWKPFAQTYGTTETCGSTVTALTSDDHILEGPESRLLSSAGKPLMGAEVKIVYNGQDSVQPEQVGEVAVRGDNVMMGYWKKPELTQQVLRGGWFRTGDMGYMDSNGYVYVLGPKASHNMERNIHRGHRQAAVLADVPSTSKEIANYSHLN